MVANETPMRVVVNAHTNKPSLKHTEWHNQIEKRKFYLNVLWQVSSNESKNEGVDLMPLLLFLLMFYITIIAFHYIRWIHIYER